jgi:zinc transporter, ZIP family
MSLGDWPPVLVVFVYGLFTALTTGLGALPFAFVRTVSGRTLAYANALASGLMLGASFGLVAEGTRYGAWQTIVGANLGIVFVLLAQRYLSGHEVSFGRARGAGAKQMLLMVGVMTVHSVAEGVAVGAAFGGGMTLAAVVTIAIAVHNVPEGLAISAVLRPKGESVARCAFWSIFSSLPQPLMAVPAFLFVGAFRTALPYGVGFAAGAMVLMVFLELLPEAYDQGRNAPIAFVTGLAFIAMFVFQRAL